MKAIVPFKFDKEADALDKLFFRIESMTLFLLIPLSPRLCSSIAGCSPPAMPSIVLFYCFPVAGGSLLCYVVLLFSVAFLLQVVPSFAMSSCYFLLLFCCRWFHPLLCRTVIFCCFPVAGGSILCYVVLLFSVAFLLQVVPSFAMSSCYFLLLFCCRWFHPLLCRPVIFCCFSVAGGSILCYVVLLFSVAVDPGCYSFSVLALCCSSSDE